jgi:hypothetical protein
MTNCNYMAGYCNNNYRQSKYYANRKRNDKRNLSVYKKKAS